MKSETVNAPAGFLVIGHYFESSLALEEIPAWLNANGPLAVVLLPGGSILAMNDESRKAFDAHRNNQTT